jgi:hypothetical protein
MHQLSILRITQLVGLSLLIGLVALLARTSLVTADAQSGPQARRGRMTMARPTAPPSSELQQVILDGEAQAALTVIESGGHKLNSYANTKRLRFDVAENGKLFTFDETPLFADGLPAYGNEFVTEGYIYPEGTLNGSNGVNADGSPEVPHKVIGRWYCRGWHIGDGAHTEKGPWVVTHQIYDFGHTAGRVTITTDGFETPEHNPIQRAIIGGTGTFSLARGEAAQTFLGFNQANGVSLRYEVKVR